MSTEIELHCFFKPFIAFLMYSVTSDKRKLNKADRSGHQNIKTKIKSFFHIFAFYTCFRTAFSHIQIRTLYVTRFRTLAFSHFAFYTTPVSYVNE